MRRAVILVIFYVTHVFIASAVLGSDMAGDRTGAVEASQTEETSLGQTEQSRSVQWFKEELRITPKYTEDHEDVFGLSWAHFLTMVFLFMFFIFGLASLLIRYRRTKELLKKLLEEKKDGNQG